MPSRTYLATILLSSLLLAAAVSIFGCGYDCEARLTCESGLSQSSTGGAGAAGGSGGSSNTGGGAFGGGHPTPVELALGTHHSCALFDDGQVACWGRNTSGQLGEGTLVNSPIAGWLNIKDGATIDAMHDHTCVASSSGAVSCWGANTYGQLGNNSQAPAPSPVQVQGLSNATAVCTGWGHSCAVLTSSEVWCWGNNSRGQLGSGDNVPSPIPQKVLGIDDATHLGCGYAHTCTVRGSGKVWCWGSNLTFAGGGPGGQIGDGSFASSNLPVEAQTNEAFVAVDGGEDHTCALSSSGSIHCWGASTAGGSSPVPAQIALNASAISTGRMHNCAAINTLASCWGVGTDGQLGAGNNFSSDTPQNVYDGIFVTEIDAGDLHSCAILNSGDIACWGNNEYGQLGNNTTNSANQPRLVVGLH